MSDDAKYHTSEHKRRRETYRTAIADGTGWCTEPICLMATRYIPPGTPGWMWDVPHMENGIDYRTGPAHRRCNRAEGARRNNRKAIVRRWVL